MWVERLVKSEGAEKAVVTITRTMVADSQGYAGTTKFTVEQKEQIVHALLADDSYMSEARKHIAPPSAM